MRTALASPLLALALAACHPRAATCSDCRDAANALADWRSARIAELRGEQGWLALVALHWLDEGEHRLGAAPDCDLVFPAGAPPEVGTLSLRAGEPHLRVAPGVDARIAGTPIHAQILRSDIDPTRPADRVQIGERFTFLVLARGGRLALRLYDRDSPARQAFTGIDTFPEAAEYRVQARFEPFASPREVDHPTVLGTTQRAELPGVAVFDLAGQTLRLTPMLQHGPHGDELLFVFRDRSSGAETYPGGRFLVAALPAPGSTTLELDFNRAVNPPCAFTPYATCPLPLPENRLPVRIAAGEKTWVGPHEP